MRIRAIRRPTALAVTAMVTALTLTSCGSETPQRAGTIDDPSATADSGSSNKRETDAKAEPDTDAAGRQLSKAEAKAALPRVSSLPAGWSVDPENTLTGPDEDDSADDKITPERCAVIFEGLEELDAAKPTAEAGVTFTSSMLGPFLGVEISSYDEEVPDDRFGQLLSALGSCPKFTVDDGESATPFTVAALSFPNYGDESAAMRMSAASEGMQFAIDLVAIRVGHNIVSVSQMAVGGPAPIKPLQRAAEETMTNLNRD